MKSAPPLLASRLWCKTAAESSRENSGRAGELIHPSACRLGDLGLTPITYREGGGGEGGGGIWTGAKEMSYVLPVDHTARLSPVSQATAFNFSASHCYNTTIDSIASVSLVLTFKLPLSTGSSVLPLPELIFISLFVLPSFHFLLSNTSLSVNTSGAPLYQNCEL